jgi:hypothetical protein
VTFAFLVAFCTHNVRILGRERETISKEGRNKGIEESRKIGTWPAACLAHIHNVEQSPSLARLTRIPYH